MPVGLLADRQVESHPIRVAESPATYSYQGSKTVTLWGFRDAGVV